MYIHYIEVIKVKKDIHLLTNISSLTQKGYTDVICQLCDILM